jgi:hypothetical protein
MVNFQKFIKPCSYLEFRLIKKIRAIKNMPYKHRKSIFFDRTDIRELIIKGYIIVYHVNKQKKLITVFGFTKFEDKPF